MTQTSGMMICRSDGEIRCSVWQLTKQTAAFFPRILVQIIMTEIWPLVIDYVHVSVVQYNRRQNWSGPCLAVHVLWPQSLRWFANFLFLNLSKTTTTTTTTTKKFSLGLNLQLSLGLNRFSLSLLPFLLKFIPEAVCIPKSCWVWPLTTLVWKISFPLLSFSYDY